MTQTADVAHAPGSLVKARGREWVVLPESEPDMLVLRPLGGADDEITAVFPGVEEIAAASFQPPDAGDLGDAQAGGLLRTALRTGFASTAGPFRSLGSIAVEPRPYQLVPLLMAMRQPTVRLAICDDVGIGKTVESGLIAKELLAQGSASGLAVLCSPALAEQWQDELRTKFGIDAELILASTVPRLERSLDWGKTLFERHRIVVVSTDFIKSPRHRHDFIKHCPDLVIVDEAHTCVPAASGVGSSGSQLRHDLLTSIAEDKSRHLLLVTATPHSGKDESFRALLGLLDPELETIDFTNDADRARLSRHYVQRRRNDIRRLYPDEGTAFAGDRKFGDAPYKLSPGYRELLDDAIDYARERVTTADGDREQRIAWWSAIALLRSLVSSPRAAAQTLRTRAQSAAASTADEADILGRPVIADMADDNPDGIDASPGASPNADGSSSDEGPGSAASLDNRLAVLAERAADLEGPAKDKKLALLVKTVKDLLAEGYSPIVFCRYIPTSEYVAEHLDGKLGRNTVVAAVNGTLSPAQRLERIEKLSAAGDDSDSGSPASEVKRVLVATDCLSEGVNLQHDFNAVIHYDLAWNPTRHEQREGRVDRFGQLSDEVKVVTIYGSDNGIDGKVLDVLIKKHREIRKSTGISVPVPDETSSKVTNAIVEWVLLRGREQQALFGLDEITEELGEGAGIEWSSMAERESRARTRYAQGSIHPDEVAREAAEIRAALGPEGEVRGFVRAALTGLGASIASDRRGGFVVPADTLPAGLRDAIAAVIGDRRRIPFRTTPAVPRGEASLTRTDPVVSAVASHVLSAALDAQFGGPRPARRCGVIRTSAVTVRTVVLLARYRYQLTLPSRHGNIPLIAEDARVLAFTGTPGTSEQWLPDDKAADLLEAAPDENTTNEFARRSISRILPGLEAVTGHLRERGTEFAEELRQAHRRVRQATDTAVRGLTVTPAGDADILGVYLYLPTDTGATTEGGH